ncbi:MAG: hypothetical protein ACRYHQ_23405 [Janthinobacterium lividum]
MASQTEVAEHLDLSQQAVSQMIAEGVLPAAQARRGLDLKACRVAYVRHLRERAAGRASDDADGEGLDLVGQRARLAKAQADAQEMRNDLMRGLVVLVSDAAAIMGQEYASVRRRLLATPAEWAMKVHRASTVAETQQLLRDAVHEALTELSTPEAVAHRATRGGRRAALKRLQAAAGE